MIFIWRLAQAAKSTKQIKTSSYRNSFVTISRHALFTNSANLETMMIDTEQRLKTKPCGSVMIPYRNAGPYLQPVQPAVQSLLAQPQSLEFLLAHGSFTDGSFEQLEAIATSNPRQSIIRCSDKGPADSLNKAFQVARRTMIGWLSADDLYSWRPVSCYCRSKRPYLVDDGVQRSSSHQSVMAIYSLPIPPNRQMQACMRFVMAASSVSHL